MTWSPWKQTRPVEERKEWPVRGRARHQGAGGEKWLIEVVGPGFGRKPAGHRRWLGTLPKLPVSPQLSQELI